MTPAPLVEAPAGETYYVTHTQDGTWEYFAVDEGHSFNDPENVAASFRAVEQHFAKHLGGATAAHRAVHEATVPTNECP